jgi:class 3 adenylate cyclase
MVEDRVQRRLAAILAADVVGYSQLMGVDEEATLRTLQNYRQIVDRLIVRHEGRIFATGGDSVLAEFSSPVEAVRCSIAIQEELKVQNAELDEKIRMHFRIGINLGDVMIEDENLFGDGVNVAARLEGLAEPGGICISGSAYEQVRDRLEADFEDIGDQSVKNIDRPVRAYRVKTDQVMVPTAGTADISGRGEKGWRAPAFGALVLVAIAAGSLAMWRPWQHTLDSTLELASQERMAYRTAQNTPSEAFGIPVNV